MIGSSLVVLLVVGALLLGLSVGGRYPGRPRIQVPSCGNCQYPVRGMPTFVCPECGADVRDVGIVLLRASDGNRKLEPQPTVAFQTDR